MIDFLKKKRLTKLKRTDAGTTQFNKYAICIGESVKIAKQEGVTSDEHALRTYYYQSLDIYYNKSSINFHKLTKKSIHFWRKVDEFREKAGVDAHTYIKSQFDWFHKHFGCPPSIHALATENAVLRAMEYGGSLGNVVASVVPYKSELSSVLRSTDETIRSIMKAQNLTKEEFYTKLVITGEFTVSKAYLECDPIYKKLVGKKK